MMHDAGKLALLLDPGLGKTATCLAHFFESWEMMLAQRALIVAPLRVMKSTWPAEMQAWAKVGGFRSFELHGTKAWANLEEAHRAHITFVNPEGLERMVKEQKNLPRYDVLYVDESTYFKSASSKRTKAMLKLAHKVNGGISRRYILTGTPRPNGVEDLYAQFAILDPEILGKTLGAFRTNFGFTARRTHWGVEWNPGTLTEQLVEDRIAPYAQVLRATDHLDLPEFIEVERVINMAPKIQSLHKKVKEELFAEVDAGEVVAVNAAVATSKCRQIASGALYVDDDGGASGEATRRVEWLHTKKTEELFNLHSELGGNPLLVAYEFKHTLAAVLSYCKDKKLPKPAYIGGDTTTEQSTALIESWNEGKLPMLMVNVSGISHGLNLQHGGQHVVWYSPIWNAETHVQFNARLWRQGQKGTVVCHTLIAKGTIDELVYKAVRKKESNERKMLNSLRDWRKGKNA